MPGCDGPPGLTSNDALIKLGVKSLALFKAENGTGEPEREKKEKKKTTASINLSK